MSTDALADLVAESERDGWRFLRRLCDEWTGGVNRFDQPGEVRISNKCDGVRPALDELTHQPLFLLQVVVGTCQQQGVTLGGQFVLQRFCGARKVTVR